MLCKRVHVRDRNTSWSLELLLTKPAKAHIWKNLIGKTTKSIVLVYLLEWIFIYLLQILWFQIPLIYYSNWVLSTDRSGQRGCSCSSAICSLICHVLMLASFLLQCGYVLSSSAYGKLAVLISPGSSWPLFLPLWLVLRACRTQNSRW